MAFKASKKRERREPEPVSQGSVLGPNAGVRVWYEKRMRVLFNAMVDDYRKEITEALAHPEVKEAFDASTGAASVFQRILDRLNRKWRDFSKSFAFQLSSEFVDKVDETSKSTSWFSMTTAGINQPRMTYNESVKQTLQASKDFNHTLITNVSQEVHEKVYNAVMLSLTSPNPEEQGASGIQNALRGMKQFTDKRIELIARDQNSKVYSSLTTERLEDNGVEYFKWLHSSAGKVPRHSHVEKDGKVFKINDPKLWTGPKADQGPPGWAINCRCRMMPLIGYREKVE
jgi:SPP1 gp7 family putative phage head morphogenesis protein